VASNRGLKADDVQGFMMAVWDSFVDLSEGYGVSIGIGLAPMQERGKLKFRAVAYFASEGEQERRVAAAEAIWPTHYATSVHALLYALLVRLWRELDAWKQEDQTENSLPT